MKNSSYLSISPELCFHLIGEKSIIIDQGGIEHLYDSSQTDILSLCDGTKTVEQLVSILVDQYNAESDYRIENFRKAILNFLDFQLKNHVLIEKENIKKSLNIFGVRGKFYPSALSVEITSRCNFSCPHCYKNAFAKGQDIDDNIIHYIKNEFGGKIKQIQLTGGEPFLNKKIVNYINELSNLFEIRIPTNGSLLYLYDDEIIKKLSYVQFSLYGSNPDEYKEFTGSEESYYAVMKSIEKVNNCGVDNIVSLVLSKENLNRMEDYIIGAIKLGAKRIKFGVPSIAGRACDDLKHEKRFLLTDEDLRVAYRNSREFKRKYYRDISIGIWSHRSQEPKKPLIKDGKYDYMLPCGAGYMSYVISQNGRLRPCELLSEDFFDLGSYEKLTEYINGEFFTEYDDMVNKLHSHMCKHGVGLECVCNPIKNFYERMSQSQ